MTIGLRVTKVTIDRGGWFNPGIFSMSKAFHHIAPGLKVNTGLNKDDIEEAFASGEHDKVSKMRDHIQDSKLANYPVAFLIAKDITIITENAESSSTDKKSSTESSSSGGGGWWASNGDNSGSAKSKSSSSTAASNNNRVVIKIPGPQIIGWFLQFTKKDESGDFLKLADQGINFKEHLKSAALKATKEEAAA